MTREEAIDLLDNLNGMIEDSRNSDYDTAFKMAVKALEQEPCDDCVRRQEVLAVLKDKWGMFSDANDAMQESIDTIEALKPVTPKQEPKTGHWIDDGFYAEGHSHKAFHCSKCGHNVLGFKEDLSNYCPNCGARMIEPQESEVEK